MKGLPVTFLCAITGLMTGLCSEQHNNQSERGVKALPSKKTKAMKRKSIYTILWRAVLLCLMLWFISIVGTGTVIAVYIVFRAVCFLLRVCLSAFYALAVTLLLPLSIV